MNGGPIRRRHLAPVLFLAALAACTSAELRQAYDKTVRTGGTVANKAVTQGDALATKAAVHGEAVAQTTSKALRKGFADLTPQEEYYIGRAVAARVLGIYRPLEKPAATRYLNTLGLTLARASLRPETYGGWHLLILDSDEINAFAAPGGFIFVTRGLFESCRTEDQLAAVIAHEVGHVTLGHGLAAIKSSRLTEAFAIIGTEAVKEFTGANLTRLTEAFAGTIDDIIDQMMSLGYSRWQEYDADAEAERIAYRAGYNPKGLPEFLRTLQEKSAKVAKNGFFSTHPPPEDRLKKAEKLLGDEKLGGETDPVRTARFSKAL